MPDPHPRYHCKICGHVALSLLFGKIHVYEVHGKSWKKARCFLEHVSKAGKKLM